MVAKSLSVKKAAGHLTQHQHDNLRTGKHTQATGNHVSAALFMHRMRQVSFENTFVKETIKSNNAILKCKSLKTET